MTLLLARIALGLLGAGAVATAALGFRPSGSITSSATGTASEPAFTEVPLKGPDLIALARRTTPFRLDRKPPAERYGAPPAPIAPPPPAVPKPQLTLSGILWGAEPAAIVEGVPGQEAPVVLRQGESVGPLRVVRIEVGRVVLRGLDTTWTLTVREPWR